MSDLQNYDSTFDEDIEGAQESLDNLIESIRTNYDSIFCGTASVEQKQFHRAEIDQRYADIINEFKAFMKLVKGKKGTPPGGLYVSD